MPYKKGRGVGLHRLPQIKVSMKNKNKIKRRSFLKATGLVSALTAAGCQKIKNTNKSIHNFLNQFEETIVPYDVETHVNSSCTICPSFCGIKVRKIGERVVKIEGNPEHPVNRGGLCTRGVAGIQHLYNPNRIKSPLIKSGGGESSEWVSVSWDEAIKTLSEKLIAQREENPAGLMFIQDSRSASLEKKLYERFMKAYGSPNYVSYNDALDGDDECQLDAIHLMQGIDRRPSYDIKNAGIVVSFSTDFLESHLNLMQSVSAYGYARREREAGRSKFVHIGARLSATAASADKWISIKPGTEAIIALSIAYVLIREDLYDYDFVSKNCSGFEDEVSRDGKIRRGFKYWVMSDYAPVDVEEITGVSAEDIIEVARALYSSKPALIIGRRDDVMTQAAVHSLNLLCGSLGSEGGMLFPHEIPLSNEAEIKNDKMAKSGLAFKPLASAGEEMLYETDNSVLPEKLDNSDSPVKLLLIKNANPVYSSPGKDKWAQAMKKIPFKVSFSPVMDETTELCDLILPDCTYLEKWNGATVNTSEGYQVFSVSKPVVAPVTDCRATEDVILGIAAGMPSGVSSNLNWKNFREYIEWSIEGLFNAGRGDYISEDFKGRWVRLLEKAGWRIPKKSDRKEFVDNVIEKGGWWDPVYYYNELPGIVKTGRGKADFLPSKLVSLIDEARSKGDEKAKEISEVYSRFIEGKVNPFYIDMVSEKSGKESDGGMLHLHNIKTISLTGMSQPNSPWLMDNATSVVADRWNTWVEINRETARELMLNDGDYVFVESEKAKIKGIVALSDGIHPECIAVPAGFGHSAGGVWSSGIGSNAADIIAGERDPLSGICLPDRAMVKIYKA